MTMIQKQQTETVQPKKLRSKRVRHKTGSTLDRPEDSVLLRLDSVRSGLDSYVLGVTSCDRRVGVSTVAGNLAVRAAKLNLGRILLVDCNTDHPRQAKNFSISEPAGLANVMGGDVELDEVLVNGKVDDLHVLVAGKSELAAIVPDQLNSMMKSLRANYDLIFLDLPPVGNGPKSILFNRVVDGIAIVSAQKTRASDLRAALRTLNEGNIDVVGIILNRARRTLPRWLDRLC